MEAAFADASPGDTILIKGGTYGAQSLPVRSSFSAATQDATFAPATGESVTFTGDIVILASHVRLVGGKPYNLKMTAGTQLWIDPFTTPTSGTDQTHNVLAQNIDGANFNIGPVKDNVTIKGGDWGPSLSCSGGDENQITASTSLPGVSPNGVTLDGIVIHDQNTSDAVRCHTGGLVVQGGTNITIRNSTFANNAIYDLIVDDPTNGTFPLRDWVIENNWFGSPVHVSGSGDTCPSGYAVCAGQADIQWKWHGVNPTNWLIRYNSFGNGIAPNWGDDAGSTWTNFRIIANTGGMLTDWDPADWHICEIASKPGVSVKYNAWTPFDTLGYSLANTPTCGDTTNKLLAPISNYVMSNLPYVNPTPSTIDYHLKAGTLAQDIATPTTSDYTINTDIDIGTRPLGAARDAGSHDRG